jgi:hypothetical protein
MSDAEPMVRAVVADAYGEPIALTLYGEGGRAAAVALDPLRAVDLARELLDAAGRRLHRQAGQEFSVSIARATGNRRRGGDRQAEARRQRDDVLRALARLNDNDAPAEQQARDLADRLARFHPLPVETIPERQLMREVVDSGLPVPSPDRLARIIRSRPVSKKCHR